VLDRVQRQARDLRRDLDRTDQRKLDEYLESVREVERRGEVATTERPEDAWPPTLDEPDVPRPQEGRPPTVPEHVRLMLDILVLALQMDRTRVATFLFQNDLTGMTFDFIEGVGKTGLHTMSHHRQRAETLRQYQLVNQWHSAQFAYVLDKMAAVDEGDGTTLLDNTMLLFGSTMMDGDSHDANDLPLIVAGGRSAGIRGGRAVRYDRLEPLVQPPPRPAQPHGPRRRVLRQQPLPPTGGGWVRGCGGRSLARASTASRPAVGVEACVRAR